MDKLQVIYTPDTAQRLDKFLVELNIQELYSRTFIEKLIEDDQILVNHTPVKKSYQLQQNDLISIILPPPQPLDIKPQDIPLDIVYEDEYIAVINKPAGLIVHPGFGNPDNTLVNAIVYRWGDNLQAGRAENRPGIVHRLDRGTTGLLLIAKDDATQSRLSTMFAERAIQKTYLAITTGIPDPPCGRIETYLNRSAANPRKMAVTDSGKWAVTNYEILRYYHYFALAGVLLETGRMHQIRVHFAHLNFPILGDLLYNSINQVQSVVPQNMKRKVYDLLTNHMHRQALHAWKLAFMHPVTQAELCFTAPLPDDMLYTLDWLEQYFAIDNDRYEKKLLNTTAVCQPALEV